MTSFFCPYSILHQESFCTEKFNDDSCNGHCCYNREFNYRKFVASLEETEIEHSEVI